MPEDYSDLFPGQDPDQINKLISDQLKGVSSQAPTRETKPDQGSAASDLWPYALGAAGPIVAKGATALAGKMSPYLAALFLSKPANKFYNRKTGKTTYDHDILDDTKPMVGSVGRVELIHDPRTDNIHISSIGADEGSPLQFTNRAAQANNSAHVFGTSDMRSLLRSLQQQYPYARTVTGDRTSGARWGLASREDSTGDLKMKLPETSERKADRLYQEEMWNKNYGKKE